MKIKTVQDLFDFLKQEIDDGHGKFPVWFDTEAKKYKYHLAMIGCVFFEETCDGVVLYEKESGGDGG